MKRRTFLRHMADLAANAGVTFRLDRRGASHDIYRWGERMIPVPRHRELDERLARAILRDIQRLTEEGP